MSNISSFRYVENINDLTQKELNKYGYYIGFPCAHGHVIRDKKEHWCYHCVKKYCGNIA